MKDLAEVLRILLPWAAAFGVLWLFDRRTSQLKASMDLNTKSNNDLIAALASDSDDEPDDPDDPEESDITSEEEEAVSAIKFGPPLRLVA
jgi:hypothetical protein